MLELRIATPDASLPPLRVRAIDLPGEDGRFTVLPGHAALVALLRPGDVRVELESGESRTWQVGRGSATVGQDRVTLLVRTATPPTA